MKKQKCVSMKVFKIMQMISQNNIEHLLTYLQCVRMVLFLFKHIVIFQLLFVDI